jgi:hypothetical protein
MRVATIAICTAILLTTGLTVLGQGTALPDVDTVLNRYYEATGGRAAHEAVRTVRTKLRTEMHMEGMGFLIKGMSYCEKPDKLYVMAEHELTGKMETGSNGKIVWEKTMAGARILKGNEREEFLRMNMFDWHLDWRKYYKSARVLAVEKVKGKPAYMVVFTPRRGEDVVLYFDVKSHLVVSMETMTELPMGSAPLITEIGDYRKVGNLLVPHEMTAKAMVMEMRIFIEEIEFNKELPVGTFSLPPAVRALALSP